MSRNLWDLPNECPNFDTAVSRVFYGRLSSLWNNGLHRLHRHSGWYCSTMLKHVQHVSYCCADERSVCYANSVSHSSTNNQSITLSDTSPDSSTNESPFCDAHSCANEHTNTTSHSNAHPDSDPRANTGSNIDSNLPPHVSSNIHRTHTCAHHGVSNNLSAHSESDTAAHSSTNRGTHFCEQQ